MKKLVLFFTFFAIAISALQVSAKPPREFSIYGGGGYSFFLYQRLNGTSNADFYAPPETMKTPLLMAQGIHSGGFSGDLGVGYTGFVSSYVGFHVGLGFNISHVGTNVDSLKLFTPDLIDSNNRRFNLYSVLSGYNEMHRMACLSIPLMLQFQIMKNQNQMWDKRSNLNYGFYSMIGVKLNVLLSNSYDSEIAALYNQAYYPDLDNWAATQRFAGLGRFKGNSGNGNIGYVHAMFAFEAGMKWRIASNMFLYAGAYLDYGLNDPTKNNRTSASNYIFPNDVQEFKLLTFAGRANLMTVGVKVRLAFFRNTDHQLKCPQL